MMIHDITAKVGAHKKRTRVGRGEGSGKGGTSGRGHKGAKSRAGWSSRPGYQGGSTPIARRFPKRGFFHEVNVDALEKHFDSGATVDAAALVAKGLIRDVKLPVKVLGNGELKKKLTVNAAKFSATAKTKIEKAGGTAAAAA
ncbi:MAG: 50S ribosomal protein L15 [Planctomycetes bacterium]|nr:50S ribosomal protein L15 [Planctomycetota bacterium]